VEDVVFLDQLDHKVDLVDMVSLVNQDIKVTQDSLADHLPYVKKQLMYHADLALLDQMVDPDQQDLQETKDPPVSQEHPVKTVAQDLPVPQDPLGLQDQLDLTDPQVTQVDPDQTLLEPQETKDQLVMPDHKEPQDQQEAPALTEAQEVQELEEPQDPQEIQEKTENQEEMDQQVDQVQMVKKEFVLSIVHWTVEYSLKMEVIERHKIFY